MLRDQTVYPLASDLAAHPGVVGVIYTTDSNTVSGDKNGADYTWNPTSTVIADSYNTIQATGVATGRYEKRPNSNTVKGSILITGVSLQTVYPVTLASALPVAPTGIFLQLIASSVNISVQIMVQKGSITKTGFNIVISGLTVNATAEIDYLVIK